MIQLILTVNGTHVGSGTVPDDYITALSAGTRITVRIDPFDEANNVPIFLDLIKKDSGERTPT